MNFPLRTQGTSGKRVHGVDLRILLLSIGTATFLSAFTFSQSSVVEGDKRKLEPKHLFQVFTPEEWKNTSLARAEDLQWFREARFGLFIHWGPSSLTGAEIGWGRHTRKGPDAQFGNGPVPDNEYDALYRRFNPEKFDARAWVKMAQDAGMKYLVFIANHHDGFCMWDTRYTNYKITNSPIKRDLLKEVADACHEAGMPLGLYYSQRDFYHSDYFTKDHQRYIKFMHDQVRELLSSYGKISILWLDAAWYGGMFKAEDWDSEKLYQMARQLQPGILINNRCSIPGDFDTPEDHVGMFQNHRPWESCFSLATQWSWKPDDTVKPLKECLQLLVRTATGDGNLLLNVGPRADGTFEPLQNQQILQMGKWLSQYGQTIYRTRGGPFYPNEWGGSTYTRNVVYLHILDKYQVSKVASGAKRTLMCELTLPPLKQKIVSSKPLSGNSVKVSQDNQAVRILIPPNEMDPMDTIVELTLDGPVTGMVGVDEICSPTRHP